MPHLLLSTDFQLYKSGVYDEPDCKPDVLVHAVLVVGYGSVIQRLIVIVP